MAAPGSNSPPEPESESDQRAVIAYLSRPDTYGVTGEIERIDTHISVVFLAGERAYKLKRAVRFDYLDYSTLAGRRKFCNAEFEINRRTAPTLYEGVVAVTRAPDGGLELDGPGEPVEWLVAMKRFAQDALFDRMAGQGALTDGLLMRLADEIAAFHGSAETDNGTDGAAAFRRIAAGNDREIARRAGEVFDATTVSRYTEALGDAVSRTAALLDARARDGKIRRCHGDLHLRNICLYDGAPTLFDAIDFNDDLSVIDVLYDLAFLLMDLEHRSMGGAANRVFSRYLQRSGDFAGLAAMPLFLACRAGVRAHTTAAAADAQPDKDAAERLLDEARGYLDLGLGFLAPARPRLIAVGGLSGSGKSVLSRALAPTVTPAPGAVHLSSDVARKLMFGRDPEAELPAEAYAESVSRKVYRGICDHAAIVLAGGYSAICDATYMDPERRAELARVARAAGVNFVGLWLDASPDEMATRVGKRRGDPSDANEAVLRGQLAAETGTIDWARIPAGGGPGETLDAARLVLDDSGRCPAGEIGIHA